MSENAFQMGGMGGLNMLKYTDINGEFYFCEHLSEDLIRLSKVAELKGGDAFGEVALL